ncbi:putative choline dehydrogenase [Cercophora newfieldiana]|uniref:Choline dehydrogenase n=1 Tax=Cercophora newfieldiana TaxID=92897 RepID=A0AA39YM27_9PEZI|nr:putative choline dehydrogenase [Cercophora newfieldiana]
MDCAQLTAEDFADKPFDFLVIGGGTAGLAVAARLSEHSGLTVGVLEAGAPAVGNSAVDFPGLAGHGLGSDLDWKFRTVPQPGLGGREAQWARGKVVGGSSALNYMTWNRASKHDYDEWGELGNEAWGWDDLLPFFKKSETFHPASVGEQKTFPVGSHDGIVGSNGPVQVAYPNEFSASHEFWHDTLNSVGIDTNDAHLAGSNVGVWTSLVSVDPRSATRSYAATAYHHPNASRPNLVVLSGAEVREILLLRGDGSEEWQAKGVRFSHGGSEFSAFASREIIVSAGTVQSPQILELSGIGGSAALSAAGIPVKVDNPNVGENLQDHLTTTLVFEVDPSLHTPDDLNVEATFAAASDEYTKSRTGPLTTVPVSMAYVPVTKVTPPDILSSIFSSLPSPKGPSDASPAVSRDTLFRRKYTSPLSHSIGHIEYVFDLGNWGPDFTPDPSGTKKYGSMLQILQYPFSRGSIHIRPSHASQSLVDGLAIDPGYFSGQNGHLDLEIALHGYRFAEKICSSEPLKGIIRGMVSPTPEEASDEGKLRKWLRRVMVTDWHPVGTCAMGGKAGAQGGVVDERLRVYGVKGLRVVDASVMPLQISAHLQATVYAIAEKAAHMILEDAGFSGE